MTPSAPNLWRTTMRSRVWLTAAVVMLWAIGIEARLVWLQVGQHDWLASRATRQHRSTVSLAGQRGEILDRNGRVLALSVDAETIQAVPGDIDDPARTAASLCRALEKCSDADRVEIGRKLQSKKSAVFVIRKVTPDEARAVTALGLPGIALVKESKRFYPNTELGAHLIGYVGMDNSGLSGIELAYDSRIRGRAGTVLIETDAKHRAFGRVERPPTTGSTVELTIDAYLQHRVERELHEAVLQNRAVGGSAIVMDPRSGEILAMANEPTFNPNSFGDFPPEAWRNRAVQNVYEPGSTFKLVTASAALEEHVVAPTDMIDASAGSIRIGSRRVEDVTNHGVLSFTDVIVESSNVGAIKVGQRLGAERLGRYVRRFGFGTRLCPDTPGENAGIVWNASTWSDSTVASVSMGYEIGVTPLQMVTAASTIGNRGVMVQPRVLRALRDGTARTEVGVRELQRTISPETAAVLTGMMEQVIERGTGRAAAIPGYTVAGKTGTANKLVGHQYLPDRLQRVVCRPGAVSRPGVRHRGRRGFSPRRPPLRRRGRCARLQAHRGDGPPALWHPADDQPGPSRGHRGSRFRQ